MKVFGKRTRDYALSLWPVLPDLKQLKATTTMTVWETMLASAGALQLFPPQDNTTANPHRSERRISSSVARKNEDLESGG